MDDQETSTHVLTVAQAAATAGVSTKTIRRWIRSGRLEAGRAGDAYVITPDALQRARDWTPSIDMTPVPWRAHGHDQDTSTLVQQLLDRIERQAADITMLRLELDQARQQVLALEARPEPEPRVVNQYTSEPNPILYVDLPTPRRPWWRVWGRAPRPAG